MGYSKGNGDGSFASGVAFREDVQGAVSQDVLGALADYLADVKRNGYIFSIMSFNTILFEQSVGQQFGDHDAWLYWYPVLGAQEDPSNYFYDEYGNDGATTGVRSSYNALVEGGFEIYFRIGEGFNGPTYMGPQPEGAQLPLRLTAKERYAFAAAKILEDLSTIHYAAPPMLAGFIEIWNEPCAIGYFGPNAKWDEDDSEWVGWSSDFKELTDAIVEAVGELGWTVPVGGFGFNRVQLKAFVDTMTEDTPSKSAALLQQIEMDTLPFVSFHWYRDLNETAADPLTEALRFPRDLVDLREAVDSLTSLQEVLNPFTTVGPPLHITEWNFLANPDEDYDFPGDGIWGAFASAGLTWMQHPDLDIQRAHFWDGRVAVGLADEGWERADNGVGVFSVKETSGGGFEFIARASAFAMAMHKGLDDDAWVPLSIERTQNPQGIPHITPADDVLEAAASDFEVTAMATFAQDEQRHTIVLTNLASMERAVTLSLDGLPPAIRGKYSVRTKSLDCSSFPVGNVIVPGVLSGAYVVPESSRFEIELDTLIVETIETVNASPGPIVDLVVEVPPNGVVRLDITPNTFNWLNPTETEQRDDTADTRP